MLFFKWGNYKSLEEEENDARKGWLQIQNIGILFWPHHSVALCGYQCTRLSRAPISSSVTGDDHSSTNLLEEMKFSMACWSGAYHKSVISICHGLLLVDSHKETNLGVKILCRLRPQCFECGEEPCGLVPALGKVLIVDFCRDPSLDSPEWF